MELLQVQRPPTRSLKRIRSAITENDGLINVEEAFAWICESNMVFKAKEEACRDAKEVPPVTSDDIAGFTELEVDK